MTRTTTLKIKDFTTGEIITISCIEVSVEVGTTYLVETEIDALKIAYMFQRNGTKIEYNPCADQYIITVFNDSWRKNFF